MNTPRPATVLGDDGLSRCAWSASDLLYQRYHDDEWGRELRGDRALFEKLSLEGFQAGLSWITILRRRDTFRKAFFDFDIDLVANLTEQDVDRLMLDTGIIRNRAKIVATISNAAIVRELVRDDPGGFERLLWSFAPTPDARYRPQNLGDIPTATPESTSLSRELRAIGLKFVGPTTLYALMQSSGMVDDHVNGCWRAGSNSYSVTMSSSSPALPRSSRIPAPAAQSRTESTL